MKLRTPGKHGLQLGIAATIVVALSLPAATGTASAEACAQPYSPLAWAQEYPAQEQLPPVTGVDVSSQLEVPPLDSDGDSVPDTVALSGSSLDRGDGTVTFESSGNFVTRPANAGDLDGNGRDEILLYVDTPGDVSAWVVPGTVSPGTHDVATVGIRVNLALAAPVADRTGDGIDDLMQWTETFVSPLTTVTSGAAIMAVGAPGDARSVAPVLSMPGWFVAFVQLAPGPPSIITATYVPNGIELRIGHDSSAPVFTTSPAPAVSGGQFTVDIRSVLDSGDGTFMIGSTSSRSGIESYLWRLDEPCAAPATPPAVETAPSFTG
jgi:hypothetical protein